MAMGWTAVIEILKRSTVGDAFMELVFFFIPLWVAVLIGLFIGWAWKPKWAFLSREKFDIAKVSETASVRLSLTPSFDSSDNCSSRIEKDENRLVTREDLEHLRRLVEVRDGGPSWQHMMSRSLPNMSYQAWRRDTQTGPPQYRMRTVYENANPELLRDFFWDDEFRSKWDDMLRHSTTLEECPTTGTMVIQWIRKFPVFCSDREYIIGRRIWKSGRTYYCVTKGVLYPSAPRRNIPRRVDLYYSSWRIQAVESKKGDGQLTACEVLLFHHEDMGIPWEIAKLGVRHGMWGAVKKIEPGVRAYQRARESGAPLSQCTAMAQINTKIDTSCLRSLEETSDFHSKNSEATSDSEEVETLNSSEKTCGISIPKLIAIAGTVVLACSLDRGLLPKVIIFEVARRFPKLGRRL
ncbi:hypothetical protein AAC387_Pa08g0619 [Persea americana]